MIYTITGVIKEIGKEVTVTDKFKKRDFVLTDNSTQYPQHITFQLVQKNCSLIDLYKVGQEVSVSFNLRGREWTGKDGIVKYFNTIEAWKVEGAKNNAPDPVLPQSANNVNDLLPNDGDDLPF